MNFDNPNIKFFIDKASPAIVFHGRTQGKTLFALRYSMENNVPILCNTKERVDQLKSLAKEIGIVIPEPVLVESKPQKQYGPSMLIQAAKAIQNDALIEEMLKYRFKRKK